jgi:hypothetical protein
MSTKTVRRPKEKATAQLPEWRRLCHIYENDSQRSICGVGVRKPGEDHSEEECNARGHTACVICMELREASRLTA